MYGTHQSLTAVHTILRENDELCTAANIRLEKTVFRFISQTRRQTESIFRIHLWVPPPFDARFDAINELSRTKGSLFYSSLM